MKSMRGVTLPNTRDANQRRSGSGVVDDVIKGYAR
jgi:hypothetical protein